ncbi:MAG: preprotein translocase subunit SecE [Dehalococcoidales bacterium]|jgi:preprotein translocase subunit SecE|nr:preprotein translocase subunit SecE [Dehalococcoidales bacterium]MDD3264930.1 preprotein translocase subunit SecE [Dehalococcoidales bacterium]MDD4322156.1 preprotein translocase subunit SecE [Dehalococcoidales bacterium]MDD4793727.1 preprotein translocase subunit SecE [Dehalococcoidales bacterium]MDD5121812.1 preprotein translocase subunit SecE [Dehalococcoidales bacterium]
MVNKPVEKKPSRFRIFGDVIGELKKVTWLTRRETFYLTGLVLLVAVFMGVILGLMDWGFTTIIDKLFLGG